MKKEEVIWKTMKNKKKTKEISEKKRKLKNQYKWREGIKW